MVEALRSLTPIMQEFRLTCKFCGGSTMSACGAYVECSRCSVLISLEDPAPYDATYYYAQRRARSRDNVARAAKLYWYFKTYISDDCLDVGCNDGSFVAIANGNGANCEGVEVNEDALATARAAGGGKFWKPEEVRGRRFSVITAFDVIEHFDDLAQFFEAVSGWLVRGGRLIITTPNKNSKWRRIFGPGWHGHGIPQYHRLVMSERFLRSQLNRAEFEVEKVFTTRPIGLHAWRLLVASGYRLRSGVAAKAAALPLALMKFAAGKMLVAGEEDTLCVIARNVGRQAE